MDNVKSPSEYVKHLTLKHRFAFCYDQYKFFCGHVSLKEFKKLKPHEPDLQTGWYRIFEARMGIDTCKLEKTDTISAVMAFVNIKTDNLDRDPLDLFFFNCYQDIY